MRCDAPASGSVVSALMLWLGKETMHHLDQTLISHLQIQNGMFVFEYKCLHEIKHNTLLANNEKEILK